MKIKIVDGWKIRNTIDTDFSSWGDVTSYPYIPKGEMWVDKFLKPEVALFEELARLERRMKGKPFAQIRKQAAKELTNRKFKLDITARKKRGNIEILLVDGFSVRSSMDPYFVLGGHDLVYSYIPKNQVWIDTRQDPREIEYTLVHETLERKLMSGGMEYDSAHDFALAAERKARRDDKVADFIRG